MTLMNIKISGTPNFTSLITAYHSTLLPRALHKFPEFKKLSHHTISVMETSNLSDLGLSKFDSLEMLINHQLTKSNPKLLLEVYGHELAHFLITYHLGRNVQHEAPWQAVMQALGLPPRPVVMFDAGTLSQNETLTIQCKCYLNNTKKIHRSQFRPGTICRTCHKPFTIV